MPDSAAPSTPHAVDVELVHEDAVEAAAYRTSSGLDGLLIGVEDVDAVDVELDSDQRLMVVVLLRPAVIRGSWWWWCSDRVDAVEGDPPQPDG